MAYWIGVFEAHRDAIIKPMVLRAQRELPIYGSMPYDEVERRMVAALTPYFQDLDAPRPEYFAAYWGTTAYQRAQQGIPLSVFLQVLLLGTDEAMNQLCLLHPGDPQRQIGIVKQGYAITSTGIAAVYEGYSRHKDEIIAAQNVTLTEVGAPIVPVHQGILVLPLVGSIHGQRASQIIDTMLTAITAQHASVVIIDITGVAVIDTSVAQYLLQAARAGRLLGAAIVLVGISPEIAQTLVQLGIELSDVLVRANLQAGIDYALSLRGLAIGALARPTSG